MPSNSIAFDRAADFYDETRGFPPGVEQPAAQLIAQAGHITAQSRVLEIGIGTGRIALPLAQVTGATIYGADLSVLMMNRLRHKQHSEKIYLTQADVTLLPFPSHAFDAVVGVHVFHLIPNWQDALREVGRVLKPGALFVNAGGGETGDPFEKLWAAYNTVVPVEAGERPGVPRAEAGTFPLKEGWRFSGDYQTYNYTVYQSPLKIIDAAERRISSNYWLTPDALIDAGVAAMRAAAAQEYDDPSRPIEIPATFHVHTYQPPEG